MLALVPGVDIPDFFLSAFVNGSMLTCAQRAALRLYVVSWKLGCCYTRGTNVGIVCRAPRTAPREDLATLKIPSSISRFLQGGRTPRSEIGVVTNFAD